MSIQREVFSPQRPLVEMGIDPSSALGARIQAIRIRRYWLQRNVDLDIDVVVTVHRLEGRGHPRAMSQTVYGVRADFKNARKITDEGHRLALLANLQDESEVYA